MYSLPNTLIYHNLTFAFLMLSRVIWPCRGSRSIEPINNNNSYGGIIFSSYFHNDSEAFIQVGQLCLSGQKKCAHQNFFNYECYLENLVHWKTCRHQQQRQPHPHPIPNRNFTARDIRIDVLRTKDPQADLDQILELWTGVSRKSTAGVEYAHSNSNSDAKNRAKNRIKKFYNKYQTTTFDSIMSANTTQNPTKYLSPEGVLALCRAICPELLTYKSILVLAVNLNDMDVKEAYEDLDASCGTSVDAVCGTEFLFRNVKKRPWAK